MANDGSLQSTGLIDDNNWPLIKFQFHIRIIGIATDDGTSSTDEWTIYAQSVEGMEVETNVIEYRHGEMSQHHKKKMPGMKTYSNVTIKKGVFHNDTAFYDWAFAIRMNLIPRCTVIINMIDHDNKEILLTWKLLNAFPVKFTPSDLNAEEDGDPAVEELELAYEYFEMGGEG
jgi:phage tail-like protein